MFFQRMFTESILIIDLGAPSHGHAGCEEDPFGLPCPGGVIGGVDEVFPEAFESVS
jgi:hypothetical protein